MKTKNQQSNSDFVIGNASNNGANGWKAYFSASAQSKRRRVYDTADQYYTVTPGHAAIKHLNAQHDPELGLRDYRLRNVASAPCELRVETTGDVYVAIDDAVSAKGRDVSTNGNLIVTMDREQLDRASIHQQNGQMVITYIHNGISKELTSASKVIIALVDDAGGIIAAMKAASLMEMQQKRALRSIKPPRHIRYMQMPMAFPVSLGRQLVLV